MNTNNNGGNNCKTDNNTDDGVMMGIRILLLILIIIMMVMIMMTTTYKKARNFWYTCCSPRRPGFSFRSPQYVRLVGGHNTGQLGFPLGTPASSTTQDHTKSDNNISMTTNDM
ncbi:hypothetical protein DPMN_060420 [Dreissena polymorpha]|uniref:Uncharacterized protein n=1 Tax=Dreissena polymorpha TaxID=45954 RepID=A0A9D4C572_DREPO|nr:hypothetical protein DPMN_060420 [Dreissena polymorpha]